MMGNLYLLFTTQKCVYCTYLNCLPFQKIQMLLELLRFVLDRVENIIGRGENAGIQHFLLFSQYFQKDSSSQLLKL